MWIDQHALGYCAVDSLAGTYVRAYVHLVHYYLDPDAEVVALTPRTLLESDRYVCEICGQGFQREQNLQMHRRRHKVPWRLVKRAPAPSAGEDGGAGTAGGGAEARVRVPGAELPAPRPLPRPGRPGRHQEALPPQAQRPPPVGLQPLLHGLRRPLRLQGPPQDLRHPRPLLRLRPRLLPVRIIDAATPTSMPHASDARELINN